MLAGSAPSAADTCSISTVWPKPPSRSSTAPHVNEHLRRRPRRPTDRASLPRRRFTHSDISFDKFLWDPSTRRRRIWLLGCQHANVLTASFLNFYLHRSWCADPLVRARDFPCSSISPLRVSLCRAVSRRSASAKTETIHGASPPSSSDTNTRAALSMT
ncbi:hypothetical protein C8R45DRAFT_401884 [Mycena sanguinolenta]|nr:hypothetical protein C8R45DRAFT_401884 [Mycena sanguinolenta]